MEFSMEQQIIFYEFLADLSKMLEFDLVLKAFYCGTRLKWGTPNCLLVIIKEDQNNRFFNEMNCEGGSTGNSYITNRINNNFSIWSSQNRPYTFHYKVITDRVYELIKNDWNKLADESWIHSNNPYVPGIELDLNVMARIQGMRVFL